MSADFSVSKYISRYIESGKAPKLPASVQRDLIDAIQGESSHTSEKVQSVAQHIIMGGASRLPRDPVSLQKIHEFLDGVEATVRGGSIKRTARKILGMPEKKQKILDKLDAVRQELDIAILQNAKQTGETRRLMRDQQMKEPMEEQEPERAAIEEEEAASRREMEQLRRGLEALEGKRREIPGEEAHPRKDVENEESASRERIQQFEQKHLKHTFLEEESAGRGSIQNEEATGRTDLESHGKSLRRAHEAEVDKAAKEASADKILKVLMGGAEERETKFKADLESLGLLKPQEITYIMHELNAKNAFDSLREVMNAAVEAHDDIEAFMVNIADIRTGGPPSVLRNELTGILNDLGIERGGQKNRKVLQELRNRGWGQRTSPTDVKDTRTLHPSDQKEIYWGLRLIRMADSQSVRRLTDADASKKNRILDLQRKVTERLNPAKLELMSRLDTIVDKNSSKLSDVLAVQHALITGKENQEPYPALLRKLLVPGKG